MAILVATELLYKHQWADTAHGCDGTTAGRCPECKGINPDESISDALCRNVRGKGHQPGCAVAKALVGYDGEPQGAERPDA